MTKSNISKLEVLGDFHNSIIGIKGMNSIRGGGPNDKIDIDCNLDGVLHCDHWDPGSGDFGPDLTIDPVVFTLQQNK
ncbi:MAG: hypothetical protein ACHQRM_13760 [Bacteroidia bacterium]